MSDKKPTTETQAFERVVDEDGLLAGGYHRDELIAFGPGDSPTKKKDTPKKIRVGVVGSRHFDASLVAAMARNVCPVEIDKSDTNGRLVIDITKEAPDPTLAFKRFKHKVVPAAGLAPPIDIVANDIPRDDEDRRTQFMKEHGDPHDEVQKDAQFFPEELLQKFRAKVNERRTAMTVAALEPFNVGVIAALKVIFKVYRRIGEGPELRDDRHVRLNEIIQRMETDPLIQFNEEVIEWQHCPHLDGYVGELVMTWIPEDLKSATVPLEVAHVRDAGVPECWVKSVNYNTRATRLVALAFDRKIVEMIEVIADIPDYRGERLHRLMASDPIMATLGTLPEDD